MPEGLKDSRRGAGGYALVMLVWVMAILTMLALGFSRNMTAGNALMANATSSIQAELYAESAFERGLHALLNPGEGESWKLDGTVYQFNHEDVRLGFSIQNERGKIDINMAEPAVLRAMFEAVLSSEDRENGLEISPDMMVDRLLDWRDKDELTRLQGAEYAEYEAQDYAVGPTNQPFRSIKELQQVLGMNRNLYEKLDNMVTVHSLSKGLNPLYSTENSLRMLPGIAEEQLDVFLSAREENDYANSDLPLPVMSGEYNFLDQNRASVYTVTGRADLPSQVSYLISMLVLKLDHEENVTSGDNKLAYRIVEVRKEGQVPYQSASGEDSGVSVVLMDNGF